MFKWWSRPVKVKSFKRYALVGWKVGETTGMIPVIVRSLDEAEAKCSQWNSEHSDVMWHVAEISPPSAMTEVDDE